MNYSGLFAAIGVLAFLQLALAIVGIVGSLISLVHSLNEETKRTTFIVFSSLGLALGVMGFWNLIFAILGFVFMMISLSQDTKSRNFIAYILVTILITGIGAAGYTYLGNKLTDMADEYDLSNVGIDTLSQLGADTSNQTENSNTTDSSEASVVTDSLEVKLRNQLISDVAQLNDYMKQIQNYKKNLQALSVNVPSLPEEIDGDSFSADETLNNDYTEKSSANENRQAALIYTPNYIFAGGRNYDWMHTKPQTDDVLISSEDMTVTYNTISTDGWTMLDGTAIDFAKLAQSDMDNEKAVCQNIQGYVDTVNNYLALKYKYQTEDIQNYWRYTKTGAAPAQVDLNQEGVAVQHSNGTYTTYNANGGVSVNVYLEINEDETITAKDMYSNTYNITKVVNEDGDAIQITNSENDGSADIQINDGYYWLSDEKNN
jgi:hypothetical protein